MKFLLNKIKAIWDTFWYALFKRYIKNNQKAHGRDEDKALSREIARYYLIERDKQERRQQSISLLILFLTGTLFIVGGLCGLYMGKNNNFMWGCFISGGVMFISILATYIISAWNKHHSDGLLFITYSKFLIAPTLPNVTTDPVYSCNTPTATSGGNVISDGGAEVTERGVCWGMSPYPVMTNCIGFTQDGMETGKFSSTLINLRSGMTYYARAYATNNVGTAYGNQVNFTAT